MSDYKPYSAYKDSGVEWLGRVPEHWQVKQFKYVAPHIGSGKTPSGGAEVYQDTGVQFLRSQNVYEDGLRLDDVAFITCETDEEMKGSRVRPGDVLLNITGASIGRSCLVPQFFEPANVNQHVCIIRTAKALDSKWISLCLPSKAVQSQIDSSQNGAGREGLNFEQIGNMSFALPPNNEIEKISSSVDRETARIDGLVAKKNRFIELLREKRQALITHTVTKGLDPNVKMKNSGVEWLGEVPLHWDVLGFQRCVFIAEGQVDPEAPPYREMVLIAPNHIESGSGQILYTETAEEQSAESGKYLCQEGDVVYSKIRPALRKVCIAPEIGLCSADMYPMRGHSGMSNQFLFWFLLSEPFSAFAVLEADRVAMPKINRESLNGVQLPRPPLNEQTDIVAHLALETARLDNLRSTTERSITLLKERRSALITAAVTGQIDLREAV
ncbi:restriction endonuclease subunit S [Pseudomonas sp. 10C3]|uniref:restriction endonuclease subunit S n=1 Tax=Pseudomonas sp. 10C3 TaxID=3118753 RepID=UPI002E8129D8|nr:restriction endonuclease subunit S [Pseudomonas sp. 10C3]MEE3508523.1 restriction endonuclease subunit S [Pseudomonas sp. 10C3]